MAADQNLPECSTDECPPGQRDPGDAVPPGVAPQTPAPLTGEDRKVRDKLERLPQQPACRNSLR